eukprot:Skav223135  [mRNA]  locus=scaffold470:136918:138549:+ [translate_table: standard]
MSRVVIITLAHRGDRRVDPLVAGPSALKAMREAGAAGAMLSFDACYCERDALDQAAALLQSEVDSFRIHKFQHLKLMAAGGGRAAGVLERELRVRLHSKE